MEHRDDGRSLDTETPGLTRRSFVSGAAKTGMALSGAAFLAACGSSVSWQRYREELRSGAAHSRSE
jgi:hypothetical protein